MEARLRERQFFPFSENRGHDILGCGDDLEIYF
jgi:hypothetical protein